MTPRGESSIYLCIEMFDHVKPCKQTSLVALIELGTALWLWQQRKTHRSIRAWDDCQ